MLSVKHDSDRMTNWVRVICGAIFALYIGVMGLHPVAAADKPLTDVQIGEANKPGTVMIQTIWTSTIAFRQPQQRWQALIAFAENQANLGLIQNTPRAKLLAAFDELLRHPLTYSIRGDKGIIMKVPAGESGSGFIVTPDGYIVTNAHVVANDETDLKKIMILQWQVNGLKDLFNKDFAEFRNLFKKAVGIEVPDDMIERFVNAEQQYYLQHMEIQNISRDVRVLMGIAIPGLPTLPTGVPADVRKQGEVTPGKDVAILKIEQNNLPTVPIGDDTSLSIGDHIVVLGFPGSADMEFMNQPKGVESTLTQGDLSARKTMPGGWSALQTSAEINHGNSGGPAFNDKGEVIGIATFGPDARGINFLVPMSIARQFLDELNVKPQQSKLSRLYQEGVSEFHTHHYKAALEKFKEVGDLSPGFPFVQDKITQSRLAIDQGLDRSWMPSRSYIAAAAGLLIVLSAVWFLMRRHSTPAEIAVPVPLAATAPIARIGSYQPGRGAATLPVAAAAVPALSFGSLQCTAGSVLGRRFEISKQGLWIGRDATKCQIVIADDNISKEHAWIVPVEEGVVVIDRGSTNGTFVNSVDSPKVSKVRLHHGDRIFIGKGIATFTYQSS